MNQKHTPGPWEWEKVAGQQTVRVYARTGDHPPMVARQHRERLIARVVFSDSSDFVSDARLIAAAPNLLAAAKLVIARWGGDTVGTGFSELRAALAKAERKED